MDFSYLKNDSSAKKTIVMLHGVGSNKEDLFGLSDLFGDDFKVFSLDGLYDLGYSRKAWYHLDFSTGKAIYNYEEVVKGGEYIKAFLDYIVKDYGVKYEDIYLLGFSQGAIISNYLLSISTEKIGGIISLSGRLLDEIVLSKGVDYNSKNIFLAHGNFDEVLDISEFEKLRKFYSDNQISFESKTYNIGHTIIREEIYDIIDFINKKQSN